MVKCNTVIYLFHTGLSFIVRCLTENSYRVSGTPKLHREFRKAVKQLPKIYSPEYKQRFYKLIDNFGTHYITKVNQKAVSSRKNENTGIIIERNTFAYAVCVNVYHSR